MSQNLSDLRHQGVPRKEYSKRRFTMKARIQNPALIVPGVLQSLQSVSHAIEKSGLPKRMLELMHLRASQINGCSVCVDMHSQLLKMQSESDQRLFSVAAWRDAPYFTDAERAALALTEAVTRMSDREEPVPDAIWNSAAELYSEQELGALVLAIAMINVWNRVNVSTKQVAGEWTKSEEARKWIESLATR
jgi:AhpD family alkylhydroperoxidase